VARYRIQVLLVDPDGKRADDLVQLFTAAFGGPPLRRGGIDVWLLSG
jgi:hypothetical protein